MLNDFYATIYVFGGLFILTIFIILQNRYTKKYDKAALEILRDKEFWGIEVIVK